MYANGKPDAIDTVVISGQHAPDTDHKKLNKALALKQAA